MSNMFLPLRFRFMLFTFLLVVFFSCSNKKVSLHTEEGFKQVNGVELYYKVLGNGKPVVILHGGPGLDHTYLLPQMEKLAQNYRLIFYDQRAVGKSSGVAEASSITLDNYVEDLEELRSQFDLDKMNIWGHSWGGMLAMFYAIKYPSRINSLMLIDSGGASSEFWQPFDTNISKRLTVNDDYLLSSIAKSKDFRNKIPAAVESYNKILGSSPNRVGKFGDLTARKEA